MIPGTAADSLKLLKVALLVSDGFQRSPPRASGTVTRYFESSLPPFTIIRLPLPRSMRFSSIRERHACRCRSASQMNSLLTLTLSQRSRRCWRRRGLSVDRPSINPSTCSKVMMVGSSSMTYKIARSGVEMRMGQKCCPHGIVFNPPESVRSVSVFPDAESFGRAATHFAITSPRKSFVARCVTKDTGISIFLSPGVELAV